jgi:trk system potassium uptake protein TrkH
MSIAYHESDTIPFLYSILITFLSALFLRFLGHKADNSMTKRDAYLVVSLSWIIFSFFGTFPLTIGEYVPSFTDAYFETMSGFTTTGATIINNVDILPHGILFWRSMTHWIGGLGIVFFTTAILPSFVGGSVKIFAAESTGPIHSRLHPRLSTSAKWIWTVYLVITIACSISFMVCGMGWFDSINYAMGTTATGGFSTHNSSIAFFHSSAIEYVGAFFCFLSGINFTLIYTSAINKSIKTIFKSSEFRFYSFITLIFSLFVIYQLIKYNGYDIEHAIRSGIFQVVSFITTTGLFSDDANKWPHMTWIILTICMFLGACSGSTSGGFKSIRSVIIIKMIKL